MSDTFSLLYFTSYLLQILKDLFHNFATDHIKCSDPICNELNLNWDILALMRDDQLIISLDKRLHSVKLQKTQSTGDHTVVPQSHASLKQCEYRPQQQRAHERRHILHISWSIFSISGSTRISLHDFQLKSVLIIYFVHSL